MKPSLIVISVVALACNILIAADWTEPTRDAKTKMSGHDYGEVAFWKRQKGDFDGAIADLAKAIELEPNDEWLYVQRAAAKEGKGDLDGAIADLDVVIKLRKQMNAPYMLLYYYISRGTDKQALGNLKGAIEDFTLAINLKLTPGDSERVNTPYRLRSLAKAAIGDASGAQADLAAFESAEEKRLKQARDERAKTEVH